MLSRGFEPLTLFFALYAYQVAMRSWEEGDLQAY